MSFVLYGFGVFGGIVIGWVLFMLYVMLEVLYLIVVLCMVDKEIVCFDVVVKVVKDEFEVMKGVIEYVLVEFFVFIDIYMMFFEDLELIDKLCEIICEWCCNVEWVLV